MKKHRATINIAQDALDALKAAGGLSQAKLDSIHKMRQSPASLEEVASHFGMSRQAVWELLVRYYRSAKVEGLLTMAELARLTGYSQNYLHRLKVRGIIEAVNIGRKRTLWKPETIAIIMIYGDQHPPICRMCDQPLPPGRSAFCSDPCQIEGGRFKNRPQAVKERQRWRQAHPRLDIN